MKLINETRNNRNREIKRFLDSKAFGFLADKFESARMASGRLTGRQEVSLCVDGKKVVLQQLRANSNTYYVTQAW